MTFGAPGVIERAYQLAQTSADVEQIRLQLRKEGYSNVDAHLAGQKIRTDLITIIRRPGGPAATERDLMADELEEIEIPVPCPGCANNTLKRVRWLKAHDQLACYSCNETIRLDDDGFRDAILDAAKSIARIRKGC